MLEEKPNKKSKKTIIIGIIIIIVIGLLGFLLFRNSKTDGKFDLEIEDTKMYPNFSENTVEYVVYTNKKQIKINCSSKTKNSGCNKIVNISDDETEYVIKNNNKEYKIKIHRLSDSTSNISITNITGIPTDWVKTADVEVEIDNPSEINDIEYSFDGGSTWQKSNEYKVTRNQELNIVVKDYFGYLTEEKNIKIEKVDSISPKLTIEKTEVNDKVVLNAVATDDESGISSYLWSNGSKEKEITVDKENKSYEVEVLDKAGNKSSKKISLIEGSGEAPDANTDNPNTGQKMHKAVFNGNGSSTNTEVSCQSPNDSCQVVVPQIQRDGYEIIGWSKNKDNTSAEVQAGSQITLKNDETYYAITRKRLVATFEIQDKEVATLNQNSSSCYIYNTNNKCIIKTPSISVKSGFEAVGWNTDKSTQKALVKGNTDYEINNNINMYSITYDKTPLSIQFKENGASFISASKKSCYKYNGAKNCSVTSPTITPKSEFSVLGWDTKASTTATWEQNKVKTISSNATYYAITRSSTIHKATFVLQDNKAATIDKTEASCYRYNGSSSCSIKAASLEVKDGYEVLGWNTNKSATTQSINNGATISMNSNATYYSITRNKAHLTATFDKNKAKSISSEKESCYIYNGNSSCKITSPKITGTDGFEGVGWNTDGSTKVENNPNSTINLTNNTTYYAVTKSTSQYTATFKLSSNDIGKIDKTTASCYRYNDATSCKVAAAVITPIGDNKILGWNVDQNAKSAQVKSGGSITLSSNKTYYTISKSNTELVATFIVQDEDAATVSKTEAICEKFNGENSCTVNIPTATAKTGYDLIGWNTNENATTSTNNNGDKITLDDDVTYYLITRKETPIKITFEKGGASAIGSTSKSCYLYNGATSCKIKSPTITPGSNDDVLGWNTSLTTTSSWTANTEKSFSKNATYYAITRGKTAYTATYTIQDKNAATISSTTSSCYRYNGASSCSIKLPTITAKSGYAVVGWSTSASATTTDLNSGDTTNLSKNTTFYTITKASVPITVAFKSNGSENNDVSKVCYKYNGATSCKITSPTITPKTGFSALGWNTSNTTTSSWTHNTEKAFSSNATYYAITKSSTAYKATFTVQDSQAATANKTSESCYRYNGATSCSVTSPTLTKKQSYYAMIGWNKSSTAKTAGIGANSSVGLTGNTTYYSITKDTRGVDALFYLTKNNYATMTITALSNTDAEIIGDTAIAVCYKYNGESNCKVKAPKLTGKSGATVHGWNTSSTSTSPAFSSEATITIASTANFYSIISRRITVTFHADSKTTLNGTSTKTISAACDSYNDNGCTIKPESVPLIYGTAVEAWGFSKTSGGTSNTSINVYRATFKENTDLYALTSSFVYNKDSTGKAHTMKYQKTLGNVIIEVDQTLNNEVVTTYLKLINDAYNNWPHFFDTHAKVVLLDEDAYTKTTGGGSGGISYNGNQSLILVPIGDTVTEYTKGTIIHEMGHAYDRYFYNRTENPIRNKTELENIYNSSKNMKPRPFREYSYAKEDNGSGSIGEFVADIFRFYYQDKYKTIVYPATADGSYTYASTTASKNYIEKLFCIAKNNYNEEASACK